MYNYERLFQKGQPDRWDELPSIERPLVGRDLSRLEGRLRSAEQLRRATTPAFEGRRPWLFSFQNRWADCRPECCDAALQCTAWRAVVVGFVLSRLASRASSVGSQTGPQWAPSKTLEIAWDGRVDRGSELPGLDLNLTGRVTTVGGLLASTTVSGIVCLTQMRSIRSDPKPDRQVGDHLATPVTPARLGLAYEGWSVAHRTYCGSVSLSSRASAHADWQSGRGGPSQRQLASPILVAAEL
jgi:hypothetical protein